MASKVSRLFQDQNLRVHSNGASVVGKDDAQTQKKAGFGGRNPLGDVSNMGKLESTKSSKKPASTNVPQGVVDQSNNKGLSKASDKVQAHGSRKALGDVSNTVKAPVQTRGSRKALGDVSNTMKVPVQTHGSHKALGDVSNTMKAPVQTSGSRKALADVSNTLKAPVDLKSRVEAQPTCFEEEGFLHDHQQCISSMRKADRIDQMDLFMAIHESDSSKKLSSPSPYAASQTSEVGPESPMRYFDMKEMPELSIKFHFSPNGKSPASPSCSSPNCKSTVSPNHTKTPWILEDCDLPWILEDCDFQVMETPQFLRH